MLTWYKDDSLRILFNKIPDCDLKEILPHMTNEEVKAITEKPFVLKNEIFCKIIYKNEYYEFPISKNYDWDGATIPSFAWSFIGSKLDPQFRIPSLIHDVLCENKEYCGNNRYLSTLVLVSLLNVAKVPSFKVWIMKHSVDNFQKVFGGWKNEKNY